MELSLREAASLFNVPERTLRARLARGRVTGFKRDGRWVVTSLLPEGAGAPGHAPGLGPGARWPDGDAEPWEDAKAVPRERPAAPDLGVLREGEALLARLKEASPEEPESAVGHAARCLEEALLDLCEGLHHRERALKVAALDRARGHLARAGGHLMLGGGVPLPDAWVPWVLAVEAELLPAVASLLRRAARPGLR